MVQTPTEEMNEAPRSDSTKAQISVQDLVKIYDGDILAVDSISFEVRKGEIFSIIGPSGCGKTTTLKSILGTIDVTDGDILIDDEPVTDQPTYERDIGMVFQHFQLFPHLTVEQNVAYGLKRTGVPKRERVERIDNILKVVGLDGLRDVLPDELSLGQKQSAALARTIVLEPSILLLDEPLGDVDFRLQKEMELELKMLQNELGLTMLYVTHDQTQAIRLADRIMIMNEGRIEQIGTPQEIYHQPRTAFVASFVGDANIFTGLVRDFTDGIVTIETDHGQFSVEYEDEAELQSRDSDEEIAFMVRPERVRLAGDTSYANQISGEVTTIPNVGTDLFVEIGDMEIHLSQVPEYDFKAGDEITIGWAPDDAKLLERVSVVPGTDLQKDILGE